MATVCPFAFAAVDPTLLAASRTLGASEARSFLRVAIPLARGGLAAGAALAWGRALGEFGATLMLAGNMPGKTQTLPLAIYTAVQTGETGESFGLVLMLTALSCLVLIASSRLGGRAQ